MKKLLIGCMVAGLALGAVAEGAFSYQGVLTMADGSKSSVSMPTITFRIYDSPTDTTVLWGKTYTVSLASDGLFTVELTDASGTGAEGTYQDDLNGLFSAKGESPLYIGLTVADSTGEITPRQKMTPVPVSSYAQNVTQAKGDFKVTGNATFNAAVTVDGNLQVKGTLNPAALTVGGSTTLGSVKVTDTLTGSDGKAMIPKGTIWMWYGSTDDLPVGWAICNGQNGTPDLRGRFIVGVGKSSNGDTTYSMGDNGGEEKHSLSIAEMPSHRHDVSYHEYKLQEGSSHSVWEIRDYATASSSSGVTGQRYSSNVGGSGSHENRPPYYALYYIMKL